MQPGHVVVLAIGIVIAILAAAKFVAGKQHGCAVRKEDRRKHGARDAGSGGDNVWIVRWSFDAPIGGKIVRVSVLVVFAIGLIVALGVADYVRQGETVMRSCIIDRGPRAPRPTI